MNKTKFFSSLLVAVLFATTSVFVSCKDYDDDIKNLQSQIDKAALKADLDALSTKLAGVESTANAAKTTAENALAKANANATEIAAVKATAEKAAADAAKALTDVAKAQSTADAAQKAAEAAQKTADEAATKKELADAVEKLDKAVEDLKAAAATKKELADAQEELKKYADAVKEAALAGAKAYTDEAVKSLATNAAVEKLSTDLNAEITGLKNTLAAITDEEKMAELVRIVGSFDTVVNTLFSAVTSVELIDTYTGYIGKYIALNNQTDLTAKPFELDMTTGTIAENSVFGDEHSTFRGETYDFVEGANIDFNSRALVRVSPVSADLTTAKILLVNSKGEGLDDYVEAGTPVRYEETGALITRGTKIQSGLWFIPFSIKEGVSENDFKAATMVPNTKTDEPDDSISILYAVAINNTAENDADRYAVSSYDVATSYEVYSPVATFDFTVNKTAVTKIRNRWDGSKAISKETTQTSTDFDLDAKELVWIANTPERKAAGLITPATEPGKYDKDGNGLTKLATANNEKRWDRNLLPVELNKAFTVELSKIDNEVAPEKKIQYYYVTLDERVFAVESAPSEWNAWNGYYSNIENLNKLTPAAQSLDITINDTKANGDIIGFRVYAVNYDGTLADPDGRAFYVQVGDPASVNTVSGKYLATVADYTFVNNDKDAKQNKFVEFVEVDASKYAKVNITENKRAAAITLKSDADLNKDANAKVIFGDDVKVHYTLLDKDKKVATKWQDIKYVAFSVNKPGYWLDNATATISIQEIEQGTGRVQNQLNVAITKTLPSTATGITWRTTLEPKDGVLTVYPMPSDATCTIGNDGIQTIKQGHYPAAGEAPDNKIKPWNDGYKWPKKDEIDSKASADATQKPYKTTFALVDLGGYANLENSGDDSYTWFVNKAFGDKKKDIRILGEQESATSANKYLHFLMATEPGNVDSKTQFDSHIDGTFAGISCTKKENEAAKTRLTHTVPNIWTGKVVFASLFNPANGIVAYGNGTYRYNGYKAVDKNELESSEFFWFYGESTKLSGCFDLKTNKEVTASTESKDIKSSSAFKADQYYDMTSQPDARPEYYTAGAFKNWTEGYQLGKLFKVDFAGSTADEKQTSYLKAKNAGLQMTAIGDATKELPTYITYKTDVRLSEAAATVMKVTSTGSKLTFEAIPGKQVVAKTPNQSATIGAFDQFGVNVPNMSFKFTVMPETMTVENDKNPLQ